MDWQCYHIRSFICSTKWNANLKKYIVWLWSINESPDIALRLLWKKCFSTFVPCVHRLIFSLLAAIFMVSVTPICILFWLFSRVCLFVWKREMPFIRPGDASAEFLTSSNSISKHYRNSIGLFFHQLQFECVSFSMKEHEINCGAVGCTQWTRKYVKIAWWLLILCGVKTFDCNRIIVDYSE